jgi:hypothetical protein
LERGLSQKGDYKQFTPSTMYCRGGKVANFGLLRQPLLFFNGRVLLLEKGRSGFEYAIICDDRRSEAWKTFAL